MAKELSEEFSAHVAVVAFSPKGEPRAFGHKSSGKFEAHLWDKHAWSPTLKMKGGPPPDPPRTRAAVAVTEVPYPRQRRRHAGAPLQVPREPSRRSHHCTMASVLLLSLLVNVEVVVPYLKSKLQSIYNREREARLQATLWGQDDARFDEAGFVIDQEQTSQEQAEPSSGQVSNLTHFKKKFASLVGLCYPWIHATNEGLSFAYQLLYLLDATAFCSPALHVLGVHVCCATGQ